MCTGGVPYYISEIEKHVDSGFMNAMNATFFSNDSILLDEYTELLGLEFKKNAQNIAKNGFAHTLNGASSPKVRKGQCHR